MSLPFTRRIVARAALLVAAGAAPLVGAAGTAGAVELPKTTGLDGVNTIDNATFGKTLGSVTKTATKHTGATGGKSVSAAPKAVKSVGKTAATSGTKKTFGKTTRMSGSLVGTTTESLTGGVKSPTSVAKGFPSSTAVPGGKLLGKGFPLS